MAGYDDALWHVLPQCVWCGKVLGPEWWAEFYCSRRCAAEHAAAPGGTDAAISQEQARRAPAMAQRERWDAEAPAREAAKLHQEQEAKKSAAKSAADYTHSRRNWQLDEFVQGAAVLGCLGVVAVVGLLALLYFSTAYNHATFGTPM